jgi:16S rRNA (guanine966-N2)-methyltransferase
MRVIAGEFRGRRLVTVHDMSVRPATDRVRQTIFDVLATRLELEGSRVLDLFAGSGSLGIEALSRGAEHVVFVESDREAARFIMRNLATLNCTDRATVITMDAEAFLHSAPGAHHLVFADPPYAYAGTGGIPETMFRQHAVLPGGYLVIEHTRALTFPPSTLYAEGPVKVFGRTMVTFFSPEQGL